MLNKRELASIRKALPDNSYTVIGERTNYSKETVRKVLNIPDRYNKEIIDAAIGLIEEFKQMVADQKNRIKQITA